MKYFIERKKPLVSVSEYILKPYIDRDREYAEYLKSILGEFTLPIDKMEGFCEYLRFTGRYDNKFEEETIRAIYEIILRFPLLSKDGLFKLSRYYIKDLFEDDEILSRLERFIGWFGYSDEMFELILGAVKEKADKLDKEYEKESEDLDFLKGQYGEGFIRHLKFIMKRKHIRIDKIMAALPDSELIKKDEQHLIDLSYKTRIYMGLCNPVSYKYFDSYIKDPTLQDLPEEPKYYISLGEVKEEDATFTKTEFLEGMKKGKVFIKK